MTVERPIIFVGGVHRSGTTLFADLLARHSRLGGIENEGIGANEGQYTQDVLPLEDEFHGPGRFAFYPAYRTAINVASLTDAAVKLRKAWDGFWPAAADYVIEKTPGNLLRATLMRQIFPTAKFIFLIRNPIAVSLATQKWSHTGIFCLLSHWIAAYDYLAELERHSLPYVLVSYEDFLQRPSAVVDACFAHIGVAPEAIKLPTLKDANAEYFSRWNTHFNRGSRLEQFTSKKQSSGSGGISPAKVVHAVLRQAKTMKDKALALGFQVTMAEREAEDACAYLEPQVAALGYSLRDAGKFPCSYRFSPEGGRQPIG